MARNEKPSQRMQASTSAKAGRNDPCPCGSGRKYKQCCLLKEQEANQERRAAQQALRRHPELIFNKLLEAAALARTPVTPSASTTESDDPLVRLWNEFDKADYEDKFTLFFKALGNEDIDLDGEIIFGMFDVFNRETLKRDERQRYNDLVHALSQAAPHLYTEKRPYLLGWAIANSLAAGRTEDVAEGIREYSSIAGKNIDLYNKALEQLEYHGYLDLLTEAAAIAWPEIEESDDIVPWGIDQFADRAVDYHVFQYLERHPEARGDESELLMRLSAYAYTDTGWNWLIHHLDWVTGRTEANWTERDFAHSNKNFAENLQHLSLQFLGYLRRERQVPYTKAEQARDTLVTYLFQRHEGKLSADKNQRKVPHPLCPDAATLDGFFGGLLRLLRYQIYHVAATFELVPAWLEFLQMRGLVRHAIAGRTLQDLKSLHEPLLKMYGLEKSDTSLLATLENWPYRES